MTIISKDMSNEAVLTELGDRLRKYRLRMNLTQGEAAEKAGLAIGTIKNLEKGTGTLASLVAALRALGVVEQLDVFFAVQLISPLAMLNTTKPRSRARGSKHD